MMIGIRVKKAPVTWLAAVAVLLVIQMPVRAAEDANNDKWQFFGEVYLWGAGIGGADVAGDDIDISFSDLIDNLDMAFMGSVAARKGEWSLLGDFIYLDVEDGTTGTANIIGRPVETRADVELTVDMP